MRRAVAVAAAAILVLAACGDDDDEQPAPDPEPTPTSTTPTTLPDNGLADGFYPVLLAIPEDCPPDSEEIFFPSRAGDACYTLNLDAAVPIGDVVDAAEPELDASNTWTVQLTLTEDGIDRFNQVAALCYGATTPEQCNGQVAIAAAGQVVSAPTIQEPSYDRDAIQVSGDLTRNEATQLAESFEG